MSVVNVQTQVISLASGRKVNRTLFQPSIEAAEPAEQLLVSVRLRDVPLVVPTGSTAADSALTTANNILLPASGSRQLLITRAVLRGIAYTQVSGTDPALLIGNVAYAGTPAVPGPGTALNLRVGGNVAIAFDQLPAAVASTMTASNLITGAAGQMSVWHPGQFEQNAHTDIVTTLEALALVRSSVLLDADADVAGQGAVTLTIVPAVDGSTDEKKVDFTVDVFGYSLPPI